MAFSFLVEDFGFELTETREQINYKGKYFTIYRNTISQLQLEISADVGYFHCEIRRLINGQPAKYSDHANCIGFESLAVLESKNNYDHYAYFAGGDQGLKGVLKNTAALFKRHKAFLTKDVWIDTHKVGQLVDESFFRKFGFRPGDNKDKPTFYGEIKKEASKLLHENGFILISDNGELPPFDYKSATPCIVFKKPGKTVIISANDWRDSWFIYHIEVNGKQVFQIDLSSGMAISEAVKSTLFELQKVVK